MTKQALTLSIVIPVYNEEHYLKACLDAIAVQTVMPDEVLIIDNNSTDNSTKIAQTYPFVEVIYEKKQSVLFARNTGFDNAKSDVIGRIDADTVLPPHWVERVLDSFEDNSIAAFTGPVSYYDMPLPRRNYWIDHQIRKYLYRGAPHVPFLFGSNSALRRNIWLQIRSSVCQKQTIHEDLDLAIHLAAQDAKIVYSKSLLAGTSSRRYDDNHKSFHLYMQMYRRTYRDHGIKSIVPIIATGFYWLGYFVFKPWRRLQDEKLRRPRKNPMAH